MPLLAAVGSASITDADSDMCEKQVVNGFRCGGSTFDWPAGEPSGATAERGDVEKLPAVFAEQTHLLLERDAAVAKDRFVLPLGLGRRSLGPVGSGGLQGDEFLEQLGRIGGDGGLAVRGLGLGGELDGQRFDSGVEVAQLLRGGLERLVLGVGAAGFLQLGQVAGDLGQAGDHLVEPLEYRSKIGRSGGGVVLRLAKRGQGEGAEGQAKANECSGKLFHVVRNRAAGA